MKTLLRPKTARPIYGRLIHPVITTSLEWARTAYCGKSILWTVHYKVTPPARTERGRAHVDYALLLFILFILAILFFTAYDFLPIAAHVPTAEIPSYNFELFNQYVHLW
jgi:hypothetical protein